MKKNKPVIRIVGMESPVDKESKFLEWYDEKHIPEALKVPGIRKVTRYKFIGQDAPGDKGAAGATTKEYPRHFAVLEFSDITTFEKWRDNKERLLLRKDADNVATELNGSVLWRADYEADKIWEP